MAEIIVDDISIYKDGTWRSIKDQQAYVNGAWKTIGDGSGVFREGNWYVLGENIEIAPVFTLHNSELSDLNRYWSRVQVRPISINDYTGAGWETDGGVFTPFRNSLVAIKDFSDGSVLMPIAKQKFIMKLTGYGCTPYINTIVGANWHDVLMSQEEADSTFSNVSLTIEALRNPNADAPQALWDTVFNKMNNALTMLAPRFKQSGTNVVFRNLYFNDNGVGFTPAQISTLKTRVEQAGGGFVTMESIQT